LASLLPLIRRTGATVVVTGIDTPEQAGWWGHTGAGSARGAAFTPPVEPSSVPTLLVREWQGQP
jgi:EAL domain-containing protein (putative c-di-GMP-specific phosphodiesterase class I)